MLNQTSIPQTFTPEQVATILQLTKNTVYDLIGRGEIVAKKIGKDFKITTMTPGNFLQYLRGIR